MAGNRRMYYTDEEIYDELENMGYNDVSSDVFQMMKHDLTDLVTGEKSYHDELNSSPVNSPKYRSRLYTPEDEVDDSPEDTPLHDINPNISISYRDDDRHIRRKLYRKTVEEPTSYVDDISYADERFPSIRSKIHDSQYYTPDTSYSRAAYTTSTQKRLARTSNDLKNCNLSSSESRKESYLSNRNSTKRHLYAVDENKVFRDESENELQEKESPENKFLNNYKSSLQKYKSNKQTTLPSINVDAMSSLESNLSSMSIDGKMKRKVLRHKEGKPLITEESIDIPSIFNSSYPETSFNSPRSFDLSFKSNSSTGSIVALSPDASLTPRSTVSLPLTKSRFPNNSRKKKSDPVKMYNYYKKYWDNYKPPGEKNHHKIRWAVRDRMLDYSM